MKKIVLHPYYDRKIDLVDYLVEFGGKYDKRYQNSKRPNPRCIACNRPVHLIGEDRPEHDCTIGHNPKPSEYCPLKNQSDHRYELLKDYNPDPAKGKFIRRQFFQNWMKHCYLIQKYLDTKVYDIEDFITRIKIADQYNLWNRRQLEEWEIPFIFMVWQSFKPFLKNKEYGMKNWVRFWFNNRIRTIDDIWIKTEGDLYMIKAVYSNPVRAKNPTKDHLLEFDSMPVSKNFLQKNPEFSSSFWKRKRDLMHRSFPSVKEHINIPPYLER